MVDLLNLARMTVASAPGTGGSVAMSAAVPGYLTFDLAGAVDGRTYRYGIRDGVNREISSGVYTASTKTLTRTVLKSTNGDAAINATINAVVGSVVAMEDIITYRAFDNIAINGDHIVSQQWSNTAVTGITNTLAYITDQWAIANGGACIVTGQRGQTTPPPGFQNYIRATITTIDSSIAATDSLSILQFIEGYRVAKLNYAIAGALNSVWGFWARSSITGTFSFALRNINNDRTYFKTYTINAANTWEWKSFSVPPDTTGTWNKANGVGITAIFALMAGSNFQGTDATWQAGNKWTTASQTNFAGTISATFDITGFVAFPGTDLPIADEAILLMRPFAEELHLCQRYYEILGSGLNGQWISTAACVLGGSLRISKRASPSMSINTTTPTCYEPGIATRTASGSVYSAINAGTEGFVGTINGFTGATSGAGCLSGSDCFVADARM